MSFDFGKYKAQDWQPRTEEVPVPELKEFFGEDENPVWVVRNLTSFEMEKARENVRRNGKALSDLLSAFAYSTDSNSQGGIVEDIRNQIDDQVPGALVLKYELVLAGSVSPKVEDKSDLITLGTNHMEVLDRLADTILKLNGQGATPGKQKPCGDKTK